MRVAVDAIQVMVGRCGGAELCRRKEVFQVTVGRPLPVLKRLD